MGALAVALRKKYGSDCRAALRDLGLPEDLLDVKRLATDAKQRARRAAAKRGMTIDEMPDPDDELRAARNLSGEEFERFQRHHDDKVRAAMADDDEEDPDRDEAQREKRKEVMRMIAEKGRDEWGWDEEQLRKEVMRFPRNGLHHLNTGVFAEDAEAVLKELGMGSKDRKRMARDRALARDQAAKRALLQQYPGVAAGLFGISEGDTQLADTACEERSAADADRFEAWYGASRIKTAL
jgi:hypothetical protein